VGADGVGGVSFSHIRAHEARGNGGWGAGGGGGCHPPAGGARAGPAPQPGSEPAAGIPTGTAERLETPKQGDPCFLRMENRIIASARGSLLAAVRYFEQQGIPALLLSDCVSGDAQAVARQHAALARARADQRPLALVSGGETTVTLRPQHGRGGRNSEYLLALALAFGDLPAWALACDTDGIDGSEDNAGAVIDPDTLARANSRGLDPAAFLAAHDSHGFFSALGDLVLTGPTRTNVNDYRVLLTGWPARA
jgi:glycerate 2-kinase